MAEQPRHEAGIQCLECRRWFRSLPWHINRMHDMDAADYRLKHGVPAGVPLVCVETSAIISTNSVAADCKRTLLPHAQSRGWTQQEFVRRQRRDDYRKLAKADDHAT